MNPATTISFHLLKKNHHMGFYFIAQFLGGTMASLLGTIFLIKLYSSSLLCPLLMSNSQIFGLVFWTLLVKR